MTKQLDSRVQYRLKLAFGKVCDDHCVHVPNLQLIPIRGTDYDPLTFAVGCVAQSHDRILWADDTKSGE